MILETISTLCLILGIFFSLTGAIGLFKFPDFFTRIHAASVTDTLAAILIILGLILRTEFDLVAAKLLLILVFLLLTSPTASHALAKSARHGGLLALAETQASTKQATTKKEND